MYMIGIVGAGLYLPDAALANTPFALGSLLAELLAYIDPRPSPITSPFCFGGGTKSADSLTARCDALWEAET